MSRIYKRFFDTKDMTLEEAEVWMTQLCEILRDAPWWVGDIARYCAARWPDTWQQIVPEGVSPGQIDRQRAVAGHYPNQSDRIHEATWSQYMQVANRPDRHERLAAITEAGMTTDESRQAARATADPEAPRWLLAVDIHYFLHRFWFSGAGVEAAVGVASWVQRTVEKLKAKGLTDVCCCFDSPHNCRKQLTATWEDKYKSRPPKDPELVQQLALVRTLLEGHGFACVSIDGWEADDVMASLAAQFPGRVTLFSQDKDHRQCLSEKCNILLDVVTTEDESTGEVTTEFCWLSAKQHTETTGLRPDQWADYQALMGDAVDGVKGAVGIGEKGAADLIKAFDTAAGAIAAAAAGDERIKPAKRTALALFADKLDTTIKLVTLKADLPIPCNTRV